MANVRPQSLVAEPLTAEAFSTFGDVIDFRPGGTAFAINDGTTQRFHDLATAQALGQNARVAISLARAQPFTPPFQLRMMERHPDGSQAFIPLKPFSFLVIVAPDLDGRPGAPRAFMARDGQGVNYHVGTWHGVLTALDEPSEFVIIDRIGPGENLEVHQMDAPITVYI